MEPVRILITGGTFDKEYNEVTGELYFKDSHLAEMLTLGRCTVEVKLETMMMVDSLRMTAEDRRTILSGCLRSPERRVVITHGTDTMVNTAETLALAGVPDKTIVLTGAMVPYKFGSSDGLFNLGSALAFAQVLPPGIYVAMNGRYFPWDRVAKNREQGLFEAVTPAAASNSGTS